MVLLQQKDPLELSSKSREFLPGSGFLSRRDMTYAVESDVKPNSFLPSFLREISYIKVLTNTLLGRGHILSVLISYFDNEAVFGTQVLG